MHTRRLLISFSFFFLALICAACGGAPTETEEPPPGISYEQAADIVIGQLVEPEADDHPLLLFGHPELIRPEDDLRAYEKPGYGPFEPALAMAAPGWFFWVDDAPGAAFAHDIRFILVDAASGEMTVEQRMWWPVLNGNGLWTQERQYWDEVNWLYSNVDYQPASSASNSAIGRPPGLLLPVSQVFLSLQDDGTRVGLVINGWEEGESLQDSMAASSDQMHDLLVAAGFDTTFYGPNGDENPDIDGVDAADDLGPSEQPWRMWLRQQQEALGPGDTLFLYLTGHGNTTSGGVTAAGDIFEDALQTELSGFDPGVNIIVMIDSCHSGGFLDSTLNLADLTITATDAELKSYGDIDPPFFDDNRDDEGMEFTSGFVEDWQGIFDDADKLADVQNRGGRAGANAWRVLASESFISAREKDAAYAFGWTNPQLAFGSPATKTADGYRADAEVQLVTSDGQGSCGYPEGYQSTLELGVGGGGMSTFQPGTNDIDTGRLNDDFSFSVSREDGGESYEGQLDPATLQASGTTIYVDSSGCQTDWLYTFKPIQVDFQTGISTGMSDGASVPWKNELTLIETGPGQADYLLQTFQGRTVDLTRFGLVELPLPEGDESVQDTDFGFAPLGLKLLSQQGVLQLSQAQIAAGPYPLPLIQLTNFPESPPLESLFGLVVESPKRTLLVADDRLLRWDMDENFLDELYPDPAFPWPEGEQIFKSTVPFMLSPDLLFVPGTTSFLLNLDQPEASATLDFSSFGSLFDFSPVNFDPSLLSVSAEDGVFLLQVSELNGEGPVAKPIKSSSPSIPPGPHGWLRAGDESPFLVHAEGSRLWAQLGGDETLIADIGVDILDLTFHQAPVEPVTSLWQPPE